MSALPKTTALCPWFGSSRMIGHHVGKALAGCPIVAVPFMGGACELAHIAARTLLCNDLHRHVINLATVAANPILGPKLYRQLRRTAFHPDTLVSAQERCRERERIIVPPPVFTWAVDYFVCAWMARNGHAGTDSEFKASYSIRYDAGGGDSAVRFRSATRSLIEWRRILSRATFQCLDCFDFLAKIKDTADTGIYCDPPWADDGDKYKHVFSSADHERLAGVLGEYRHARVVLRLGEHPLARRLYPQGKWQWTPIEGRTQANKAKAEVLITNQASGGLF